MTKLSERLLLKNNPEIAKARHAEYCARWRAKNKKKIAEYMRCWRAKNQPRVRENLFY